MGRQFCRWEDRQERWQVRKEGDREIRRPESCRQTGRQSGREASRDDGSEG